MDNPQNINYKSFQRFSKNIELLALSNKGKVEASVSNFKAIMEAQNIKGGINVFTKESGLFREDRTFLSDADIISLLNDYNFPIGLRTRIAFADLFAKEGDQINLFNENIEKTNLDTSRNYIREVFETIEFDPDFLSHITDKEERKKVILKFWETWLQCVYYQGTILDKDQYVMKNVLVFQGRHDIGKTRFFRTLTPKDLDFRTDNNFLKKRDDLDFKITALFCEIDDFDSMSKREFSNAENFISKSEDFYRKPYSKEPLRYPRVTTFIGTPYKSAMIRNSENTQFWICKVKRFSFDILNKVLATEEDIWKLWKEVSSCYEGREQLFEDIEWANSIFRRTKGKVKT